MCDRLNKGGPHEQQPDPQRLCRRRGRQRVLGPCGQRRYAEKAASAAIRADRSESVDPGARLRQPAMDGLRCRRARCRSHQPGARARHQLHGYCPGLRRRQERDLGRQGHKASAQGCHPGHEDAGANSRWSLAPMRREPEAAADRPSRRAPPSQLAFPGGSGGDRRGTGRGGAVQVAGPKDGPLHRYHLSPTRFRCEKPWSATISTARRWR